MSWLEQQIQFIVEIDKLKTILRQTQVIHENRRENDAEHSWHLAVMAILLQEHANEPVDLPKVLKMVLLHDLVEIDAGDTFCYDQAAGADKAEREERAAERIFGLLPREQAEEFHSLWREFEEMKTPEARFAAALDRFQPMLHNHHTKGGTWSRFSIVRAQVEKRAEPIEQGAKALHTYARGLMDQAISRGYLKEE